MQLNFTTTTTTEPVVIKALIDAELIAATIGTNDFAKKNRHHFHQREDFWVTQISYRLFDIRLIIDWDDSNLSINSIL